LDGQRGAQWHYGSHISPDEEPEAHVRSDQELARHVADASFGKIRQQLGYKTGCNGGRTVVVDRWFPSSKTRSGCGAAKAKLALPERTYASMMCPVVLDRDVNAADNLAELGEATVAGSGPETINGRGGQGVMALPANINPAPRKRVTPGLPRKAGLRSESSPMLTDLQRFQSAVPVLRSSPRAPRAPACQVAQKCDGHVHCGV